MEKYQLLTKKEEKNAEKELDKKIKKEFEKGSEVTMSFGSGVKLTKCPYVKQTSFGELRLFVEKEFNNRAHLYLLNLNPRKTNYTSDAELNIPFGDGKPKGLFVKKGNEFFWCRKPFPSVKKDSIGFFRKQDMIIDLNDKNIIKITSLESRRFAEDLAEFVNLVLILKGRK